MLPSAFICYLGGRRIFPSTSNARPIYGGAIENKLLVPDLEIAAVGAY